MQIHLLDLDFMHLDHTIAAFLLEGPEGWALVETGPYSTFPVLKAALKAKGLTPGDIRYVFLTHIHFDHAGAAWALAKEGAKIIVHPRGISHLANPEKLYQSARMIYGDAMDTLWGAMEPIPESQLLALRHGGTISAIGLHFTAWYTPGHAVHHVAWQVGRPDMPAEQHALFTGDVAGIQIDNQAVVPPCPPPDIQIEDWRASLFLLRQIPPETLYLTHFGKVTNKKSLHLDALERRLLVWSEWMEPFAEKQTPVGQIVPLFEEFVRSELIAEGVTAQDLDRYEAANPAYMSVAGLMRYWTKKMKA